MIKPNNITDNDWKLLQKKYKNLNKIIKQLNNNFPVQYLIGNVNFYGNQILVTKNVLIPRFETETLVEKTLNYIKKLNLTNASLLEIGTGSGCISISLKSELSSLEITAIDISSKAINMAKKNARLNKTKINFIKKDLFKYNLINKYDCIISNPPYLLRGDNIDPKTLYEPETALYADKNGLDYYLKIFELAKENINPDKYLIALEIDESQGKELTKQAKKYFPKSKITLEKDLPGKDRYLFIMNK